MPQTNQPKIFISHSWEDKPLVRRLEKELQAAGAEVWVDHTGIRGGDNLPERISEALEWCNTLVLVWSKTASQSRWVKLEWTNALSLERNIIPCRLDDATLPGILAHKAYVPFRDVEAGIAQLLQALRLNKPASPTQTPQVVEPPARVIHAPLQEAVRPAPIAKPSSNDVLRLRSTPATLSGAEVKAMLRKYDFYDKSFNPGGKGIAHQYNLEHGGKVVFDNTTGLMWQQRGLWEQIGFAEAEKYVRDLNTQHFASFSDWRLPTLEEAMSLVEHERNSNGLFESNLNAIFAKTSLMIWTADEANAGLVWAVYFSRGSCMYSDVDVSHNVRAVRSGQSSI